MDGEKTEKKESAAARILRLLQSTVGDIKPASKDMTDLDWTDNHRDQSLKAVFTLSQQHASLAIDWYLHARKGKRRLAYSFRLTAILSGALAGALPMLSEIFSSNPALKFSPAYASLALAVTALSLSLDRFFGFSTSWLRFIMAEQDIRKVLQEFQLDWQAEEVALRKNADPTPDDLRRMIGMAKLFMNKVNDIIRQETQTWVAEFQDTLKQLDQSAKARETAMQSGAANISVTNGDTTEAGWNISVDNSTPRATKGKTASLAQLTAGPHVFTVTGKINGQDRSTEAAAVVPGNGIVEVSMTL